MGIAFGRSSADLVLVAPESTNGVVRRLAQTTSWFSEALTTFTPGAILWAPTAAERSRVLVAANTAGRTTGRILRFADAGLSTPTQAADLVAATADLAWVRAMALSPDHGSLYVVARSASNAWAVRVYAVNVAAPSTAALTATIALSGATNPAGIVFHPTNPNYFFVTDSRDDGCNAYYDPTAGNDFRCFDRLTVFSAVTNAVLATYSTYESFQVS